MNLTIPTVYFKYLTYSTQSLTKPLLVFDVVVSEKIIFNFRFFQSIFFLFHFLDWKHWIWEISPNFLLRMALIVLIYGTFVERLLCSLILLRYFFSIYLQYQKCTSMNSSVISVSRNLREVRSHLALYLLELLMDWFSSLLWFSLEYFYRLLGNWY